MIVLPIPSSLVTPKAVVPKQCRLLGATVKGVGLITVVGQQNVWRWALIERPDGSETHAFLSDLSQDQLVMPDGQQPYRELTRLIGPSHFEDVYELVLPDLTPPPAALPALGTVPCVDCGGDGGFEDFDGKPFTCATCNGSGEVERCSGCGLQPSVLAGLEVCACAVAEWSVAA